MGSVLNRWSGTGRRVGARAPAPGGADGAPGLAVLVGALALLSVAGPVLGQEPPSPDPPSAPGRVVAAGVSVGLERDSIVRGDIHSNGDVALERSSEVDGGVTLVGTLTNSNGTVTGTVTQVATEALPAIPTEAEARSLADRIFEQDTDFVDGRIDDVVFVAGTATLSGAVLGTGTVIATQDVVVGPLDPSVFEPPNYPVLMSVIAFQNVTITGFAGAAGTVLAGVDVTMDRSSGYHGIITAHGNVLVKSGSLVVFESFDDMPPVVNGMVPADGSVVATAQTEISATFTDDESGVKPQSVALLFDGIDHTAEATITASQVVLPPGLTLADGPHTVDLSLADFAGNPTSTSWSFVVDTVPPGLTFTEPVEPVILNDPTPRIVLAFADATSGVDLASFAVEIDGLSIADRCYLTASEAYCAPPELPFAEHVATAEIRDLAGHQATASLTYETRQDLTAPDLTLTSPADGALLASGTVQVMGTVTDDGMVTSVLVNGEAATLDAGGFTAAVELPEGTSVIEATAEDWTGKQSSTALVVTVDTTAPTIVLDEPARSLTNQATARVSGRVTDPRQSPRSRSPRIRRS